MVGLGALSIDMFLPSLPTLAAVYETDAATAKLTITVFLFGLAAAQLVFGPLSDRFGRRRVLIAGLGLYAASGIVCAVAPTIRLLVAARLLQAFGAGSGPVVARAIVRDLYERDQAARVLAVMATVQALNPILAPVLGGYLHEAFGWRSVFVVLAGFGTLFTGAAWLVLRETNVRLDTAALQPARLVANVTTLLRSPTYLGYVLAVALMFSGQFAFISGSAFVLISGLGVSPQVYGLCFASVAGGIMAGALCSSRLGARIGGDHLIRAGTVLGATAGVVMAGLAWSGVAMVAAILVPMFFYAMGLGLVGPNAMAGAIGPFPRMAGLASAVLGVVQMTAAGLYGMAVAHVSSGTAVPMATAIAASGMGACAAFALMRRRRAATRR